MVKAVRADFRKPVDAWFRKLNPEPRVIAEQLHRLIPAAAPALRAEPQWGMPGCSRNGLVGARMGAKAHVSIFFHRGNG